MPLGEIGLVLAVFGYFLLFLGIGGAITRWLIGDD